MTILTLSRRDDALYPADDAAHDVVAQLRDEGVIRVVVLPQGDVDAALYEVWKAADIRAHQTRTMEDAKASGRLWAAWLEAFDKGGSAKRAEKRVEAAE